MRDASILPRTLPLDVFAPLVGATLWADCDPRPVPLELVEASPLVNHARLDRPPFILIFRSAPDAMLVAARYVLRGDRFGPDLVEIAPVARPAAGKPGHYYQAVFN